MTDSDSELTAPDVSWELDIDFQSRAEQDLKEFQILAAKAAFNTNAWDKMNSADTQNLVELILGSDVDLKPLCAEVTNSTLLDEVYGDVGKVRFDKIVCQLVMAEKAFPGYKPDLLNYLQPTNFSALQGEHPFKVVSFRDTKKAGVILLQLVAMLHLPLSYTHPLDEKLMPVETVEFDKMAPIDFKNVVDFTFAANKLQMGVIASTRAKGSVNFQPVEEPDFELLSKNPLRCTTAASPSTLCLFGNMGPTFTYGDKLDVFDPIAMKYFSQPSFNLRSTVVFDRSLKMLQTCAGKGEKKCDLVTHGVCLVPYFVKYTTTDVPKKFVSLLQSGTAADDSATVVTTWNSVKPCCDSKNQIGQNLCGHPIAEQLGFDTGEGDGNNDDLAVLFRILLGRPVKEGVQFCEDYTKITAGRGEPQGNWKRLNDLLVSKILIESVDKYYQGFRSIASWQTLYCRLLFSHLPYAKKAFRNPTTIHNLIYQCLVMIQASSRFRLSYLGGLGRQFGVIHSLLGVDPSDTVFPLKFELNEMVVPPFEIPVVGATNQNVDLVDIGADEKEITKQQLVIYQTISGDIQSKDEAIVKTDITNFFIRWCGFCSAPETNLLEIIKPLELQTPLGGRDKPFYRANNFITFDGKVPLLAIRFIANELISGNADSEYLRTLVDLDIRNKNKAGKQNSGVTIDSTWEDKAAWFETKFTEDSKGYVTRFTKFWSMNLHVVVFIMSHGFQWYPNRDPVGPLLQFLQDTKTHCVAFEGMFFPNPDFTDWVGTSTEMLTDQSLEDNLFILPTDIKKLSPTGDNTGQCYMHRLRCFVVNPIKALTSIFLTGIVQGASPTSKPQPPAKFVLISRHHPAVFEEILGLFQRFGQVLPISAHMMEHMPTVCDLLRLNTFSKKSMDSYCTAVLQTSFETKLKEPFLFYDNDKEQQFSNVSMAVAIVICLLCGNIAGTPGTEEWQNIVRLNLSTYTGLFSRHQKCYGLNHQLPEEGTDVVPKWLQDYKRYLHIPFQHPIGEGNIWEHIWSYKLADVIDGLFYREVLPDDFVFPETMAGGDPMPDYRVTLEQRRSIEKFVKRNFKVVEHYYGYFGGGLLDAVKVYVPPPKPTPSDVDAEEVAPKGNERTKTTPPVGNLKKLQQGKKTAKQKEAAKQKEEAAQKAAAERKALAAQKAADKKKAADKEKGNKAIGSESSDDSGGLEKLARGGKSPREKSQSETAKSKPPPQSLGSTTDSQLRSGPRTRGEHSRSAVVPPLPNTSKPAALLMKRKRAEAAQRLEEARQQEEAENDDQDHEESETSEDHSDPEGDEQLPLVSYRGLNEIIESTLEEIQPFFRIRAAFQRAEKEMGVDVARRDDNPILVKPENVAIFEDEVSLVRDKKTEHFKVKKNFVAFMKRSAFHLVEAQAENKNPDFETRVMAYFNGSGNYPTSYAPNLKKTLDDVKFPEIFYPAVAARTSNMADATDTPGTTTAVAGPSLRGTMSPEDRQKIRRQMQKGRGITPSLAQMANYAHYHAVRDPRNRVNTKADLDDTSVSEGHKTPPRDEVDYDEGILTGTFSPLHCSVDEEGADAEFSYLDQIPFDDVTHGALLHQQSIAPNHLDFQGGDDNEKAPELDSPNSQNDKTSADAAKLGERGQGNSDGDSGGGRQPLTEDYTTVTSSTPADVTETATNLDFQGGDNDGGSPGLDPPNSQKDITLVELMRQAAEALDEAKILTEMRQGNSDGDSGGGRQKPLTEDSTTVTSIPADITETATISIATKPKVHEWRCDLCQDLNFDTLEEFEIHEAECPSRRNASLANTEGDDSDKKPPAKETAGATGPVKALDVPAALSVQKDIQEENEESSLPPHPIGPAVAAEIADPKEQKKGGKSKNMKDKSKKKKRSSPIEEYDPEIITKKKRTR